MLDKTDLEIIRILRKNGRVSWQEIGDEVHLTGQAVANRITHMKKQGIIKHFSTCFDLTELGYIQSYITVYMKTVNHSAFQKWVHDKSEIQDAHRISGEGCYILNVLIESNDQLLSFLDDILQFGNYKVNISIQKIK